jgi:hypothetical protein
MGKTTNYGSKNHLQGSYTFPGRARKEGEGKGGHGEDMTAVRE